MNVARLQDRLVVVREDTGVAAYDFDFELHFDCRHPYRFDDGEPCVLRVGPIADYAAAFAQQAERGLRLVNSPEEHRRASELDAWYPRLADLTPRTRVCDRLPPAAEVQADFGWPVFVKGVRQTSRHDPGLSVARDAAQYESIVRRWSGDPILHWQRAAVREFVPLAPVPGQVAGKLRPSMEYRSFWWRGECVGWGRYWHQVAPYGCPDESAGRALAQQAAARVDVPFVVVDVAKTADGRWIVIECNDAQESGYAGVAPVALWQQVLERMGG